MKTSDSGIDMIKSFEGLRLTAYKDSAGVWTIGYGHTKGARRGQRITAQQAEDFLREDLEVAERAVSGLGVRLNQARFDALVSFTFNLGGGWTRRSGLLTKINDKDWPRVPMEMTKWVHAGGRPLLGLARRRVAEAEMFVSAAVQSYR